MSVMDAPISDAVEVSDVAATEKPAKKTIKATELASSKDSVLSGKYAVAANLLNVRNGAGTNKTVMAVIPKDTIVRNYGFHTVVDDIDWLYVQLTHNDVVYTGFCDSRYLIKK